MAHVQQGVFCDCWLPST